MSVVFRSFLFYLLQLFIYFPPTESIRKKRQPLFKEETVGLRKLIMFSRRAEDAGEGEQGKCYHLYAGLASRSDYIVNQQALIEFLPCARQEKRMNKRERMTRDTGGEVESSCARTSFPPKEKGSQWPKLRGSGAKTLRLSKKNA